LREIAPEQRHVLNALFANFKPFPALAEMVLEGLPGKAIADDSDPPRCAGAVTGHYAAFAGDASAPGAAELVGSISHLDWGALIGDSEWMALGRQILSSARSSKRNAFSSDDLDVGRLMALRDGVDAGAEIKAVDVELADRMVDEVSPYCLGVFDSSEEFLQFGFGYCALIDGRVAAAATSAFASSKSVEIQITTAPEFRNRGLATSVSAAVILHSLDAGLDPQWSTSNPVSYRLAERLGYVPAEPYEWLSFGG
jgi:hypothetical protein